MAISLGGFSGGGGGASTDTLDDVTGRGATTTNAITVGGLSVGTAYTMPSADGSTGQAIVSDGAGNLSFTTIDPTGGLEYKGSFNATTGQTSGGTTLDNAEQGDYYKIDTAGTYQGQTWAVGDSLIINADMGGTISSSKIDKIDNTEQVTSVNGNTGAVTLSGDDLAADHSPSHYTEANSNIDGHLSGIDSKLGTLATVATSGAYSDLSGLPTLGTASASSTTDFLASTAGLNDLSDVSYTAGAGIDNYVLTYDHSTTSWGAEVVPSAPVTSVNGNTGAVSLSGNDLAADHSPSHYTEANSNIDGHLSGIDSKLGTLATVATSGAYSDLSGLPTLGTASASSTTDFLASTAGLNDLSDVSYTAGAGIDNYVLTYDHSTTSWGAEASAASVASASETVAGVIEIATDLEAQGASATDKALVPSNLSSIALSSLNNDLTFLSNVVEDTTPQLGGDLDTNQNELVTASNRDLILRPNGTGHVVLGGNTNPAELHFYCETNDHHHVGFKAPAHSELNGSQVWRLPTADASTSGDALVSDGNGNLSFTTISGGGGAMTIESKNANFTASAEYFYLVDTTAGNTITCTLPNSGVSVGDRIKLFNHGAGTLRIFDPGLGVGLDPADGQIGNYGNERFINSRALVELIVTDGVTYEYVIIPQLELDESTLTTTGQVFAYNSSELAMKALPYTFPASDGTANQILSTSGSGVLSFIDQPSSGGGSMTYSTETSNLTAQANYHYSCGAGDESFTIQLPTSGISAGSEIRIKNMGTGTITIDPQTREIDGSSNDYTLDIQYSAITLVSTGSNWEII